MDSAQINSLKNMTPEKKLQIALNLYYSALKLKEAGLRKQHPDWSDADIKRIARVIFLYART